MPTISQLPPAAQVTSADQVPLSQGGATRSVSIGTLLSAMQPAILTGAGTLLGRSSLGTGGPEPVNVGAGLALNGATLAATGMDHAGFGVQTSLQPSDQVVLNSAGHPKLMEVSLLRDLFTAGSNVVIGSGGTISAEAITAPVTIATLPVASAASSQDLIAINQAGVEHAISYATLINGQTIDSAQAAAPAQDSDTLWVAQGSSTMVRQDLGALWAWFVSKLPSAKQPVVELTVDTTLDTTVHNGRILVCSQPLVLQTVGPNMGSGFTCDVLNMSSGALTLGGSVVTSSGDAIIPPGQTATIHCLTYSGGTIVYAALSTLGGTASAPGTVTGLSVDATGQSSITLDWLALTGASSYVIQYRVQGAADWLVACSGVAAVTYSVGGLLPNTTYEFAVTAVNGAGSSPTPATTTATTAAPPTVPGQVTEVKTTGTTTTSVSITWTSPTSGGPATSYTVQFRISGATSWTTASTGVTGTQYSVISLVPNTTYDFQVAAVNDAGAGPTSAVATTTTLQVTGAVTSITWNVVPSGSYAHGVGSIGVNAHVNPATAAIQFGFSSSASVLPSSWAAATYVNTDLWGAYVTTPPAAGTWYAWASGTDGSCPTVNPTGFTVT